MMFSMFLDFYSKKKAVPGRNSLMLKYHKKLFRNGHFTRKQLLSRFNVHGVDPWR
jgi:hypothetical protein